MDVRAEEYEHRVHRRLIRAVDLALVVADAGVASLGRDAVVVSILHEGRPLAAVAELDDRLIVGQATPGGDVYVIAKEEQAVVADERVRLDGDACVVAGARFGVELQDAEGFDDGRLKVHALVAGNEAGVAVEGHADGVMQVGTAGLIIREAVGGVARHGAFGHLGQDVCCPIALVALGLHKDAVACDILAVQSTRDGHGTGARACAAVVEEVFVDIDSIRCHSCEAARGDGGIRIIE